MAVEREPRAIRTVNVEPEVWEEAKKKAKLEGRSLSSIIRDDLAKYIRTMPRENPKTKKTK